MNKFAGRTFARLKNVERAFRNIYEIGIDPSYQEIPDYDHTGLTWHFKAYSKKHLVVILNFSSTVARETIPWVPEPQKKNETRSSH